MDYKLDNQTLTLYFVGELNSYTADETEKEIDCIMSEHRFKRVVLDFEKLQYISSAGLRIILKIKRKYSDIKAIKVNDDIYSILEMVRFDNILGIERL